ncbi:MAG: TonB-dependent receptor [Halieaceae bacterium]
MQNIKCVPFMVRKTAIAASLLMTMPVMGQQLMLEEVIVTAQKREQTIQDVPASVAAISADMLARTNTTNFTDLGKITSGVNINGGQDGFGNIIRIRGVGNNSFAPAIRPAVGIFIDDMPLASTEAAFNNLADIERIEILKGPQSTLFGKEVSAGAIALTTRRPDTDVMDGYVEGNFGSENLQEYRIGGNLPLGDMFAVRASLYHNERDGMVDNISTSTEMGEYDKDGGRIRVLFEPSDDFSAILTYEYHETEVIGSTSVAQEYGDLAFTAEFDRNPGGPTKLNVLDPYDRKTDNSNPSDRDSETENIYLNVDWVINDQWSLASITSQQDWESVVEGQFPQPDGFLTADTSVGPYYLNDFINEPSSESFTQELRFSYDSDNWSSIIGAFYADTELISYTPFGQTVGIIPGVFDIKSGGLSDLTEDITEWAVFTHNIFTIREGLELTFGLRYSDVEKESVKGQLVGVGPIADLNASFIPVTPWADDIPKRTDSWDEVTGTIKVNYWLNDDLSIYGGWDRGFKAGGHDVCKGTEPEPICPEPFESEVADNFEIGFKGRFNDSIIWNGAVFYQLYDDYQVEIQDEVGIGNTILNAASAEITGVETDLQWLASENLLIEGNVSYIDARWDDFENAECLRPQYQAVKCDPLTNTQDLSGKRLNYTSPWSANMSATWSDSFNNGMGWYVRGEYVYRDDVYFFPDLDPDLTADDYSLFNAQIGITAEDDSWEVMLWGKNILDEEYLQGGSRNRDASVPAFGGTPSEGYRVTAGEEATYGVTLKYRFGGV